MIPDALHANDHMGRERFHQDSFQKGDHRGEITERGAAAKGKVRARARSALLAVVVWGWLAAFGAGQEGAAPSYCVLLEPKFMKAPVSQPVAGAQKTELVAAVAGEDGPEYLSREQFEALQTDWAGFLAKARGSGEAELKALQVDYERDEKKVIRYARVRSKRGLVAAALLAPGFSELFKDTLGEPLLVVVPNRYTAYVFPRLASRYEEYAPLVLEAYRSSAYPVSKEVFELGKGGLKAVGVYGDP